MALASLASVVLSFVLVQTPQTPTSADERPRLEDVVLVGVTVYDRDTVMRALRLRLGEELPRAVDELAAGLERRYRLDGYLAARAMAAFAGAEQRLTFVVDEGRLASVVVEGLTGRAAARARRVLGLEVGAPIRDRDVLEGLRRLEDASRGALQSDDPEYRLEPGPDGVQLVVRVRARRAEYGLGPRGPAGAAYDQRVDGIAPWIGGALTLYDHASYDHLRVYARAAYGFASKRGQFVAGAARPFGGRLALGGEAHAFTDTDDGFRATGLEETLGTLLFRSTFRDYFRRSGGEVFAFVRLSSSAQLGVTFRADRHETLVTRGDFSLFGGPSPRPNPPIAAGRSRSLIATGRWATHAPLFDDPDDEPESFLLRDLHGAVPPPRLDGLLAEATLEVAARGLGGDFAFRRLLAQVRGRWDAGPAGSVRLRLLAGVAEGEPPPQRRFALGGLGTLRGYHYKEAVGDDGLLASLELGGAGDFPRPGLVFFYDGGAVWSRGTRGRWMDDIGVGLAWGGAGRPGLRVDVALPLDRAPGRDRVRATVRLQAPF